MNLYICWLLRLQELGGTPCSRVAGYVAHAKEHLGLDADLAQADFGVLLREG